jgi:hypothetical protein
VELLVKRARRLALDQAVAFGALRFGQEKKKKRTAYAEANI